MLYQKMEKRQETTSLVEKDWLYLDMYQTDINWLFALTCQEKLVGTTIYVSDMNWLFATTVWWMIRGFYSSQCAEECV